MELEVLIKRARIIDGTGSPWFRGAVGVRGGEIKCVVRGTARELTATREIDADGSVVCPGFIDLHSHSDLEIFSDPMVTPKIAQGITTEIVGQDGFGMAPARPDANLDAWWRYLGGFYPNITDEGPWPSIADYLQAIDGNGTAPNVATLVGHGMIRANVLGMSDRTPSDEDYAKMQEMVTDALQEGAVGFSTGLDYTPQCYATTEEVRQLASQLTPFGLPFVAHIRSYGNHMWEALDEFIDIGASENVPLHLSHFKLSGTKPGLSERVLHIVQSARERNVDFTADIYPYVPGSGSLFALLPGKYHSMNEDELRDQLKDEEMRSVLAQSMANGAGPWNLDWGNVVLCNITSEEFKDVLGRDVNEAASERNQSPVEFVCDLLLVEDFQVGIINTINDDVSEASDRDVQTVLAHRLVGIGSDGIFGEKPHPRTYGTYPRILGHYVREKNLISLEEAVRKMTSLPARIFHLQRKGIVRSGFDADLVIFDPDTVSSPATFDVPNQTARGVENVLVNGEFVVRDGDVTKRTPGRALRS